MIRDTKSVPVRGLKIVTASEKCGGSVLNLGWWWWWWWWWWGRGGGGWKTNLKIVLPHCDLKYG